jgi:dTDP-4-dehydrorhamnose 3,5-epimerase
MNLYIRIQCDLLIITPEIFKDDRGFFMKTYRKDKFSEFGLDLEFVQSNSLRRIIETDAKECN